MLLLMTIRFAIVRATALGLVSWDVSAWLKLIASPTINENGNHDLSPTLRRGIPTRTTPPSELLAR